MKKLIAIRNLMRVIGLSSAMLVALTFGASIAKANVDVDVTGTNKITGPSSNNENEWDIDVDIDVDVDNDGDIDNDQEFAVNTGDNDINDNTTVEDFSTGDISGTVEVQNIINMGDIEVAGVDPVDVDVKLANGTTGPSSNNENKLDLDVDTDIDIDNDADIDNDIKLRLNTGDNDIDHNTVVGDISTGDIKFTVEMTNEANGGMGDLDLSAASDVSVSGTLANGTTGPNSNNENKVKVDVDTDIDIDNDADIDNDTKINANTGANSVDHNTVVGDVKTGDVKITVTTTNTAN